MTNAQHTPGPLICEEWEGYNDQDADGNRYWQVKPAKFYGGAIYLSASGWMLEGTARLLAATYTSYDKHFGHNAIAAAEADLLGELIEALREQVAECFDERCEMCSRHEALLAKAGRDA